MSTLALPAASAIFFCNVPATTEIYTLSLHDALLISGPRRDEPRGAPSRARARARPRRSEEHTSELQSLRHLVCRLLLEKKKMIAMHDEQTHIPGHACSQHSLHEADHPRHRLDGAPHA